MNHRIKEIKPNFDEAVQHWEAYWNHTLLDRPVLCGVIAPQDSVSSTYKERVYGDLDQVLSQELENAKKKEWLGDSIPNFWSSLGTHEIASYCGYEIQWGEVGDTNWCKQSHQELREQFPIQIAQEGFWFQRAVEMYRRAREIFQGRLIPFSPDFHTNLDLLLSIRGDANLCMDTYDCPEDIEKGLEYALEVFRTLWDMFKKESGCEEYGYYYDLFSLKPTTSLACDFSAMISTEMFHRFALPSLLHESELVGERTIYHWDGPAAIKHREELVSIPNLHTFRYVPTPGTYHSQFIELYQYCQSKGKSICFTGSPEEIQMAHKELNPAMTCYHALVESREEFEQLEQWLRKHT